MTSATANTLKAVKSVAAKKTDGRGRKPLTELQISLKLYVAAIKEEAEATEEFELYVDSNSEKSIINIAKLRISLLKQADAYREDLHHLARNKNRTPEQEAEYISKKNHRDEIYAQLNEIPPLGISQEDWDSFSKEEKAKEPGRPKVPVELRYARGKDNLVAARTRYVAACKEEGEKPMSEAKAVEYANGIINLNGRPDGGEISDIELSITRYQKKIDAIDDGSKQRSIDAKMESSIYTAKGKRMGRKFRPLAEIRQSYVDKINEMKAEIEELESGLNTEEYTQRQIHLVRRDIASMNAIIAEKNIDIIDEPKNKDVIALMNLTVALDRLLARRALFETGAVRVTKKRTNLDTIGDSSQHISQETIRKMAKYVQAQVIESREREINARIQQNESKAKSKSKMKA